MSEKLYYGPPFLVFGFSVDWAIFIHSGWFYRNSKCLFNLDDRINVLIKNERRNRRGHRQAYRDDLEKKRRDVPALISLVRSREQCRENDTPYTWYFSDISKLDKLKSKQWCFPIQYQLSLNLNFCMAECSPCLSRNHDDTGLLSTILLSRQLLGGRLVVQWTTRGWNKTRGSTGSLAVRVPASPDHQNLMNINFHIPPNPYIFPTLFSK